MGPNSSPATRLPYEILREIMLYVYTYDPEMELEFRDLELVPHLIPSTAPISASHVCRSWRHALLSDPTMWTTLFIPQMKSDEIMELLHRSGSTLLNVFLRSSMKRDYYNASNMNTLSAVFQQIHRFKTFHVYMYLGRCRDSPDSWEVSIKQVLSYLQRPAPALQALSFSYVLVDFPFKEMFLDAFYSINAPNLRYILRHELSTDFRELRSFSFRDLSRLYLIIPESMDINFGLFLDLLELSPGLEVLDVQVDGCFNRVSVTYQILSRRVSLPCMQSLVLEVNQTAELVDLISECVIFPSTLQWDITSLYLLEFAYSPPLILFLSQAQFASLSIQFTYVYSDEGFVPFVRLSFGEQPSLRNLAYFYDNMTSIPDLWDSLTRTVTITNVTHLGLKLHASGMCIPQSSLLTLFTSMERLESVTITGRDDRSCLSCISALIPNPESLSALEYNTISESNDNPVQDPDLDMVPTDDPEDLPPFTKPEPGITARTPS